MSQDRGHYPPGIFRIPIDSVLARLPLAAVCVGISGVFLLILLLLHLIRLLCQGAFATLKGLLLCTWTTFTTALNLTLQALLDVTWFICRIVKDNLGDSVPSDEDNDKENS
jgi:hypothetical protein